MKENRKAKVYHLDSLLDLEEYQGQTLSTFILEHPHLVVELLENNHHFALDDEAMAFLLKQSDRFCASNEEITEVLINGNRNNAKIAKMERIKRLILLNAHRRGIKMTVRMMRFGVFRVQTQKTDFRDAYIINLHWDDTKRIVENMELFLN